MISWFGHGCFGQRMLLEHELCHRLGMDALLLARERSYGLGMDAFQ